ncbi:MAG: hypothetical protein A2X84_10210 [Desulfuromonadaceae bacterium GWC2_58_13]|nr:MAG: hypothetical protein A2X84_10210 [Desulfuromonadaceae bacterium GWC2_58_13]
MEVQIRELFRQWGDDDERLSVGIEELALKQGSAVYQETLRQLTSKTYDQETARRHWQLALQHRDRLFPGGRPFNGLRPALLDYLHSVAREMRDPRIVEAGQLENIRQASITDGLTGLYHQTYFKAHLEKLTSVPAGMANKTFAVVMFDLDHFKQYNDRCGHLTGDYALKLTAEQLQLNLRPGDMACRYGGEEFALLLYRSNIHEAYDLAERFRCAIEETDFPGQEMMDNQNLTISGGIAIYPNDSTSASELLAHADKELYRAKEQRNIISPSPNGQRQEIRLKMQSLVEFALDPRDTFQPGLSFDISSTGLSFGCSPEQIQTGSVICMRLKQPFWPTNWELRGTVRNIQKRNDTAMVRVGLEFDESPENIWLLLPERPQPFKKFTLPPNEPED